MPFFALCLALGIILTASVPSLAQPAADEIAVDVRNLSEPVACAEEDNVHISFRSPDVRRFRIEVRHPAYISAVVNDQTAPDWTDCDMTRDPVFVAEPRRFTLYETPEFRLVGHTSPSFWRPSAVPFRLGNRVEQSLHLVQLWALHRGEFEEVLVLYPQDGYWRARPFPPPHLNEVAYGSSFLIGPVEVQERPIIALTEVSFDPATLTFRLGFQRGGAATLRLDAMDESRMFLDVAFEGAVPADKPFAALRSMYVTERNADAARVTWRAPDGKDRSEVPVLGFSSAAAVRFWLGRLTPSQHNTSAPDFIFGRFQTGHATR